MNRDILGKYYSQMQSKHFCIDNYLQLSDDIKSVVDFLLGIYTDDRSSRLSDVLSNTLVKYGVIKIEQIDISDIFKDYLTGDMLK